MCGVLRQSDSPADFSAADCRMSVQCTSCRRQTLPSLSPPPPLTVDWDSGREMLRVGGGEVGGAAPMLRLTPGMAACSLSNCSPSSLAPSAGLPVASPR